MDTLESEYVNSIGVWRSFLLALEAAEQEGYRIKAANDDMVFLEHD